MFRVCFALLLCLSTPVIAAPDGRITVIDGDTLDVGGVRVRLHGIDAPEVDQTCTYARGGDWACGEWVTGQVAARYGGQRATCQHIDTDRYGRIVAKCFVNGQDIGEDLVLDGLAFAYRDYSWDYDTAEKAAAINNAGLWSGDVQNPAAFRADSRPAPQTAPGECIIKGNISSNGRIYHMPHNEHYQNTRIDTSRGERWFCSEAEARAAGWRPARN